MVTFLFAKIIDELAEFGDAFLVLNIFFLRGFELGKELFLLDFLAPGVLYEVVSKARIIWDTNYAQIFWTGKLLFTSSIFLFAQTLVRVSDSRPRPRSSFHPTKSSFKNNNRQTHFHNNKTIKNFTTGAFWARLIERALCVILAITC